jgi:hypothetical protein
VGVKTASSSDTESPMLFLLQTPYRVAYVKKVTSRAEMHHKVWSAVRQYLAAGPAPEVSRKPYTVLTYR